MVLLCFVLHLPTLSLPLLRDLKQALLQLANLYAISLPQRRSDLLGDRICLCYVLRNLISGSDEFRIAYSPKVNFCLHDFHHAVNNLPTDAFSPEIEDSGSQPCRGVKLSTILGEKILHLLGDKDITSKVIVLSSSVPEDVESVIRNSLSDAADKCVSVEFLLFEQMWSHLCDMQENINNFVNCISELDNCSFHKYLPDVKVLHGLLKIWLHELKESIEGSLQARFSFKSILIGSLNQIHCNLFKSFNPIPDGFTHCQSCRCHGIPLNGTQNNRIKGSYCPVTGNDLGILDVIENSVKVGEKTLLFLPSFESCMTLQDVSSTIDFNIIERINLKSLNEGAIFGTSYVVVPYYSHELESASDESDNSELNDQLFQALCRALHVLDEGLICSSACNIETMVEAAFHCYYVLQPSHNGPMLLRRLAGSEETLPARDLNRLNDSTIRKEIEDSIQGSLLKMESRDYNPLLHERGFHKKLNSLVKESLQFGSIAPKRKEATSEICSSQSNSSEFIVRSTSAIEIVAAEEIPLKNLTPIDEKSSACITEEWEQLVVNEVPKLPSHCILKPKLDCQIISLLDGNRDLAVETSRILERLEAPRVLKTKAISPVNASRNMTDTCEPTKRPLIPFQSIQASEQALTSSQLMKPSFQRVKRKHQ